MTMPDERTRAELHTKEFLEDLMSPGRMPDVPQHVREEARRLLRQRQTLASLQLGPLAPHSKF